MAPPANSTAVRFLHESVQFTLSAPEQARGIRRIVGYLARAYGVSDDEVALLVLDPRAEYLRFAAPDYLSRLEAVLPFQPHLSIAGASLWERKVKVENDLPAVNHLSYFETVKQFNPRPFRIGKILTIPICAGRIPVGVVQISRKLEPGQPVGPDFSREAAVHVEEIELIISRLLQSLRSAGSSPSIEAKPRKFKRASGRPFRLLHGERQ